MISKNQIPYVYGDTLPIGALLVALIPQVLISPTLLLIPLPVSSSISSTPPLALILLLNKTCLLIRPSFSLHLFPPSQSRLHTLFNCTVSIKPLLPLCRGTMPLRLRFFQTCTPPPLPHSAAHSPNPPLPEGVDAMSQDPTDESPSILTIGPRDATVSLFLCSELRRHETPAASPPSPASIGVVRVKSV